MASDGHGGTLVYDPPGVDEHAQSDVVAALGIPGAADQFVFKPGIGQQTPSYDPGLSTHVPGAPVDFDALMAHAQADGHMLIADDALAFLDASREQLAQHHNDFHFA